MEPDLLLEELGFTGHEARVYLGLLHLGQATVLQLARETGLKRPTIYLILDSLTRRGYAVLMPRERKKIYIALPPERIKESFERKRDALEGLLPRLAALYNTKTSRPAVQLFEGLEGINALYEEIAASGEKEFLTFFSLERISAKGDNPSFKIFIELLKNPRVRSRDIMQAENKSHFYLKAVRGLPNYKVRFVSEATPLFTDNIIWNDNVAIFSFEKEFALVIRSKDVASTFRSLFELAWHGSDRTAQFK